MYIGDVQDIFFVNRRYEKEKIMAKKLKLKMIPLGGLNEIGKNITAFEIGGEILVVDCGMAFPEDGMFGVDCVIPDMTYLINNKDKVNRKPLIEFIDNTWC